VSRRRTKAAKQISQSGATAVFSPVVPHPGQRVWPMHVLWHAQFIRSGRSYRGLNNDYIAGNEGEFIDHLQGAAVAAGQESVDLGQEVLPSGIALRQQVVAAVERDQAAVRDLRSQQP
jgi:hypothetical protein